MRYINNLLSEELATEVEDYLLKHPWTWGFYSAPHPSESSPHWSIIFGGQKLSSDSVRPCEKELSKPISTVWEEIKDQYFQNDVLVRCYANATTKGIDQRVHQDDMYPGSKTLILYVNKIWNVDWAGETIVWNREQRSIVQAFFPKFNCGLLIDGSSWHGVRPISTYCNTIRMTLMFKTRPMRFLDEVAH